MSKTKNDQFPMYHAGNKCLIKNGRKDGIKYDLVRIINHKPKEKGMVYIEDNDGFRLRKVHIKQLTKFDPKLLIPEPKEEAYEGVEF